tara:strand:- start:1292 stop:1510 length:219 start_codon:yes stop_codon:yes gene_type:complete
VDNNWIKIYTSTEQYKINLLKGYLLKRDILTISINKKDSSYLVFGEIELYVKKENVILAKNLIEKQNNEHNA